jgi:hypothetical protein
MLVENKYPSTQSRYQNDMTNTELTLRLLCSCGKKTHLIKCRLTQNHCFKYSALPHEWHKNEPVSTTQYYYTVYRTYFLKIRQSVISILVVGYFLLQCHHHYSVRTSCIAHPTHVNNSTHKIPYLPEGKTTLIYDDPKNKIRLPWENLFIQI